MTEDKTSKIKKSKRKTDVFTVWVAILLYISFGILLTIGSIRWVRSALNDFFDISYAGYGMLIIIIISFSELWALFIQIPSIKGYEEIVAPRVNTFRICIGAIILVVFTILCIVYFASPQNGVFHRYLAKTVYSLNGHRQNDYVERLAMIDEVIDRGGTNAKQFAERGKLYLEIAEIKADGSEEYRYSLPDDSSEECYKAAIDNFDDAITQDGEVAEYYYLRGKAKFHDRTSAYTDAKNDFEKAILLDDSVPDYYFYSARAWYKISKYSTDSDKTIQNALHHIESAIEKYTNKKSDTVKETDDGSDSKAEAGADDTSADESEHVDQDKDLAEYYYYAGLISYSMESDGSLEKAIENYKNATIFDSKNAKYFSKLGSTYYESDDLTKAESAFDRAISIDKVNSDFDNEGYHLAWKAHVIEDERIDDAIEAYERSLQFREDYEYSYRRLAKLYQAKNDNMSAKDVYNRAIQNCTENAEFYYRRGVMYYHEDDFNHTIEDMQKAMEADSSYTATAYYYIGSSYYVRKDYSEAYRYYQLAKDNGSNMRDEIDTYMNNCLEHME